MLTVGVDRGVEPNGYAADNPRTTRVTGPAPAEPSKPSGVTGCHEPAPHHHRRLSTGVGSVDSLSQVHDEPLGSAHRCHRPDALELTDAADEVVALRRKPIEDRQKIVYFERQIAKSQFVVHWFG